MDGNGDADGGLAVYVYEGPDATTGDLGDPDNPPLTTDEAELNSDGNYDYRIGFLEAGEYTAAVTCESDSDRRRRLTVAWRSSPPRTSPLRPAASRRCRTSMRHRRMSFVTR
ncbi:MAG: hypothetical protein U5K33_04295 [Halofilum sp. (in: g-proteobacteria)]|nr:hypothetical protein [Halofilum sp. (in: g-proteobacteria)]